MTIVVFGSVNMDLVARAVRLPAPGETVAGYDFRSVPGGKGANQAVACARLGAPTAMVGRVGNDGFGAALRANLAAEGIDTTLLATDPASPTGVALIALDERGENTIIVVPGANGAVGAADLVQLEQALDGAAMLLLQLELPLAAVVAAAEAAHRRNVPVLLDPAPAQALPAALYTLADLLTPNETEAAALVGFPLDTAADIERAATILHQRGARTVVIKLGGRGAYTLDAGGGRMWPPFAAQVIDSVGAGDAFNGGVAVALASGLPLAEAVRWGLAAGALAVSRPGAQAAMPRREEVVALLGGP